LYQRHHITFYMPICRLLQFPFSCKRWYKNLCFIIFYYFPQNVQDTVWHLCAVKQLLTHSPCRLLFNSNSKLDLSVIFPSWVGIWLVKLVTIILSSYSSAFEWRFGFHAMVFMLSLIKSLSCLSDVHTIVPYWCKCQFLGVIAAVVCWLGLEPYWMQGDICKYWIVLLLGDILMCLLFVLSGCLQLLEILLISWNLLVLLEIFV